jgi:hypothetical protein
LIQVKVAALLSPQVYMRVVRASGSPLSSWHAARPKTGGKTMMDIAGALFFFGGIIVVVAIASWSLVLAWGERQTRHIAAPEAKAAKPARCEVPDAVKKAA